jgi:hypothetical protein
LATSESERYMELRDVYWDAIRECYRLERLLREAPPDAAAAQQLEGAESARVEALHAVQALRLASRMC